MYYFAHFITSFYCFYYIVCKILWMRRNKSYSFYSFYFIYLFQKFSKRIYFSYIFASFSFDSHIRVNILSKQSNFFVSLFCQTFYLCYDIFCFSASFSSSYIWNYAIRTEIIATIHN